jgi:prophage tail gpP-like protein
MSSDETMTFSVNGQRYERWEEIRVTREIDRSAADFNIAVSERFLASARIIGSTTGSQPGGNGQPATGFPLGPFQECTVAIGGDPVLTGTIDNYLSEVEADRHAVRVTGRSKTEDIVDCTPDIAGGQFAGYKLDVIARAIAGLFKIDVVVQTDVGEPFPDATIERHETGFAFLQRLCRLRSVLATDDEQGRLVLNRAGSDRAHVRCTSFTVRCRPIARPTPRTGSEPATTWTRSPACSRSTSLCKPMSAICSRTPRSSGTNRLRLPRVAMPIVIGPSQ